VTSISPGRELAAKTTLFGLGNLSFLWPGLRIREYTHLYSVWIHIVTRLSPRLDDYENTVDLSIQMAELPTHTQMVTMRPLANLRDIEPALPVSPRPLPRD
jgi:hypothetical protein